MFDFNERVALVTGASKGIGKAIAIKLAGLGCFVAITNRNADEGQTVIEEIRSAGGEGMSIPGDIADKAHCDNLIQTVLNEKGKLDILVNNAGITRDNLFLRMSEEQWQTVIDTNLNSVFRLASNAVKPMLKARYGRIINITSVVGCTGNPGQTNYAASKAGVIGFTKSLAKEIASRNITCNAVAPGFIESDMTNKLSETQKEQILKGIPSGRIGIANDIAHGTIYLASEEAAYVNGTVLHINGGMY